MRLVWPWSGLGAALPELSEGQPVRQPLPAGLSLAAPTAALRYRVVPLCGPRLRFRAVCCRAASTQRVPFHTGCRGRKQPQLADTSRCIAPCRLLYRSGEPRRLSSRAAWLCVQRICPSESEQRGGRTSGTRDVLLQLRDLLLADPEVCKVPGARHHRLSRQGLLQCHQHPPSLPRPRLLPGQWPAAATAF